MVTDVYFSMQSIGTINTDAPTDFPQLSQHLPRNWSCLNWCTIHCNYNNYHIIDFNSLQQTGALKICALHKDILVA